MNRKESISSDLPTLVPWEPFRTLRDMLTWDPFRDPVTFRSVAEKAYGFEPRFDVKETGEAYLVTADVPGVKESDLDVSAHGNRLQISGKRQTAREEQSDTYFLAERTYGSFARSFTLPEDCDPEKVRAELKEGVLTVNVAKRPGSPTRKISVKAS